MKKPCNLGTLKKQVRIIRIKGNLPSPDTDLVYSPHESYRIIVRLNEQFQFPIGDIQSAIVENQLVPVTLRTLQDKYLLMKKKASEDKLEQVKNMWNDRCTPPDIVNFSEDMDSPIDVDNNHSLACSYENTDATCLESRADRVCWLM